MTYEEFKRMPLNECINYLFLQQKKELIDVAKGNDAITKRIETIERKIDFMLTEFNKMTVGLHDSITEIKNDKKQKR